MNITEAKKSNLIIESWDDKAKEFVTGKWRLILEIQNNSILVTNQEYTTQETEGLVNLLERVNKGPYK